MLNTNLSPWPDFDATEVKAARLVLESGRVNYHTGSEGENFEKEFAAWSGSAYAVALMNGTVALDLALKALDIGPGDEVVVTPRTFIASVSSVVNAGAIPVFADVDRDSGNISAATIAPVLSERTRAILCVHLGGWPCDVDDMMAMVAGRNIAVIEDCAQAHGAQRRGRSVGSIGHIGAWSFCQDKIMTTGGEGGMVTTDDHDLWSSMWSYKDHGKSWEAVNDRQPPPGYRWLHESFGTNWRMLEMQAAIGRIQLLRMADWTAARHRNAMALAEVARRHEDVIRAPVPEAGDVHAWYRFYAYVRPEGLRSDWPRDRIVSEITARGALALQGSCSEVYLEKAFDGTPWRPAQRLPAALELGETSLAFLTHPTLTADDMTRVCSALDEVLSEAKR